MQLFLSPSHATLLHKFERNVTRQTQLCRRHQTVSPIGIKQSLSMGRGLGDLCPPPQFFAPKSQNMQAKKLKIKIHLPEHWNKIFIVFRNMSFLINCNLQLNLQRWPTLYNSHFFLAESPYIDSNLNLSAMATFFCLQGGHCGEVQLYIHFPNPCYYFYSLRWCTKIRQNMSNAV